MKWGARRLGALGPGLLFAAAAVGVSHLVQSTRAGADYGLGLIGLVLLANLIKYPAFRFGPHYAAATGQSLLEGYRHQGRWALVVYGFVTVATMFTVQAAVTLVTAALAISTLSLGASTLVVSGILIGVCAALLAIGHYRWLERVTKVLVAVLTLSTVVATVIVLPRVPFGTLGIAPLDMFRTPGAAFFAAALVGWMPSAIDVSVWQSLWTLARRSPDGRGPTLEESTFDFHVGYGGTIALAVCFVTLGAGVMYGTGKSFDARATVFARQVIELYAEALGAWATPLIGVAALAVMFSTTLTVVDGFPRALSGLVATARTGHGTRDHYRNDAVYWSGLGALAVGSLALIGWFAGSLKVLVDVATTLSFLTAPVLSFLNHRAVLSDEVPLEARPAGWLRQWSGASIAIQAGFAALYLVVRFAV